MSPYETPPVVPRERREFLVGLGIGAVPLVLALIALGLLFGGQYRPTSPLAPILNISSVGTLALLPLEFVAMIILVIIQRTRQVGLGMLTALVASVVIAACGCFVVPTFLS